MWAVRCGGSGEGVMGEWGGSCGSGEDGVVKKIEKEFRGGAGVYPQNNYELKSLVPSVIASLITDKDE